VRLLGIVGVAACLAVATAVDSRPILARQASDTGSTDADAAPRLDVLIARAATYLTQYARDAASVVAEENYVQRLLPGLATRQLRSDLLFATDATGSWIGFRDVFEVDGRPVRDRDERLGKLFARPEEDAVAQGRRIALESARFNLDPPGIHVSRTINSPLAPLIYLRADNQSRSAFTLDRVDRSGPVPLAAIRFVERAMPRIIASDNGSAGRGTFWLDPATGRIHGTQFEFTTAAGLDQTLATIRVTYALDRRLDLWLPSHMDEQYEIRRANLPVGEITGAAAYSNYRRFGVDTSSQVK
jgi:hypothetical protein